MSLTLVELDRPAGARKWYPFTYEEAGLGFNRAWLGGPAYPDFESIFLRVLENNNEVARVHLHNGVGIDHYADVPTALEIQFIQVRNGYCGLGIGHAVIDLLHSRYPDRRLVARSEDADRFWLSLGWHRHLPADPEEARRRRPLFIQPQP
jgi:hypothetical protein